jgi:hypothetical protein
MVGSSIFRLLVLAAFAGIAVAVRALWSWWNTKSAKAAE